ncbi:uncharacterized membrane protein YcaP (DUF421 family) [Catenulispora sp. MAP12-49]|uniref:DUF421 domain-containing protein n=1 Tax=Catenulispora sp. MAP12-49 TaxID=3156302 RepID=UPI0035118CB3
MWHDLFTTGVSYGDKTLRTIIVYAAIVVLLRLAGKRELAQLNTLDLSVVLLLSNVVQNAVIGPDNSLIGGIYGAAVLIAVNALFVRLQAYLSDRTPRLERVLEGSPSVLIRDGKLQIRTLRRLALRPADVIVSSRKQGAEHVSDVREMVIAPGGTMLIELKESEEGADRGDVENIRADLARIQERLDMLLLRNT